MHSAQYAATYNGFIPWYLGAPAPRKGHLAPVCENSGLWVMVCMRPWNF